MKPGWNWDLSAFFPGFNSSEMVTFKNTLKADLQNMIERARAFDPLNSETIDDWEKIILKAEDLYSRAAHLFCYVGCLSSTDARNQEYQRETGQNALLESELTKLEVELKRCLKKAKKTDFEALKTRNGLKGAEYYLVRLQEEAKKSMPTDQEILAAEVGVDGISGWGRLYDTISGKMEFDMVFPDGRKEKRPMAQRRSLMEDPDPAVRKAAFEGGNAVWDQNADVCAAAINHIAGTRLTLNKHRGVDHFLDAALFQARISRPTLDALFAALDKTVEIPRSMARAKAKALGQKALGWQDQEAPLPVKNEKRFEWESGKESLKEAFDAVFPELASFLQMTIDKNWIEAEVKSGKRPGAYCTSSPHIRESRVYMTFGGSMGDLFTLAHEIGHAYHTHVMRDLRPFAQSYPMPLAESASTFAEMIFSDGVLADPGISPALKASILNMKMGDAIAFLLNIPTRFTFEKNFHEERQKGEVGAERLKELMVQAQRHYYADTLEQGQEDPLFWASKLHFYITEVTFYNFPYTIGFLLSRGLFARFKKEGADFLPKYKEFLRLSGSFPCEEVAFKTLGIDLKKPAFWVSSIKSMEDDLKLFERYVLK